MYQIYRSFAPGHTGGLLFPRPPTFDIPPQQIFIKSIGGSTALSAAAAAAANNLGWTLNSSVCRNINTWNRLPKCQHNVVQSGSIAIVKVGPAFESEFELISVCDGIC